jgi:hypothetical protein
MATMFLAGSPGPSGAGLLPRPAQRRGDHPEISAAAPA